MYDLFGLGNAIVDIEVNIEESFLQQQSISRGHMTLIDDDRMHELMAALHELPMQRCSGGSAANTIFSAQSFGLTTAYTCKVASDPTGDFFVKEMSEAGIVLNNSIRSEIGRSGECLVMISSDAQRTMNTNLGGVE